jgi:glycosyltransferase involved in cell wall biosynthesis
VTGRVIPPKDVEAMREVIDHVLHDDERRSSMARAARLRARREFSLSAVAGRFRSLYEEALA